MIKKNGKLSLALIFSLLLVEHVLADMLDLLNSKDLTSLVTSDETYSYVDTYINTCLNKFDTCSQGVTLVMNVTVVEDAGMNSKDETGYSYGRVAIISSGGDSPYTWGGFYLHQLTARGDFYLEFGLSLFGDLYTTQINVNERVPVRIGVIWDKQVMKVYVDGVVITAVNKPVKRPFVNLNFSPIRYFKYLKPVSGRTRVNEMLFNDTALAELESVVKGSDSNYFLTCYQPTNEAQTPGIVISTTSNTKQSSQPVGFDFCKDICFNKSSQIMLLQKSTRTCYCVANSWELASLFTLTSCSDSKSSQAYNVSNIKSTKKFEITAIPVIKSQPIEIGDTVVLNVSSSVNQNYMVYVNFSDSLPAKISVGDTLFVYEYDTPGEHRISVKAVSLSNSNDVYQTSLSITVDDQKDKNPMYQVYTNYSLDSTDYLTARIGVLAAGGQPFSCSIDFGDSSPTSALNSLLSISSFDLKHTYTRTGVYNLTATCTSLNDPDKMTISRSMIVYVRNDSSYSLEHSQLYLNKNQVKDKQLSLSLPVEILGNSVRYQIYDISDVSKTSDQGILLLDGTVSTNSLTEVMLDFNRLRYSYNSLLVQIEGRTIASYVIVIEDDLTEQPTISVLSDQLKFDHPIEFDVAIKKIDGMAKIEYGDGSIEFYSLLTDKSDDTTSLYHLKVTHSYQASSSPNFVVKITIANHLYQQTNSINLKIENDMATFVLEQQQANLSDISQEAKFVLYPLITDSSSSVDVSKCVVTFDPSDSTKVKIINGYSFNSQNSYRLVLTQKYTKFGVYKVVANCSNSFSFSLAHTIIKVGIDLTEAYGYVVNNIASTGTDVAVFIHVADDTKQLFGVMVDFGEYSTLVPSSAIASNGTYQKIKVNYVPTVGVTLRYSYLKAGQYQIKANLTNNLNSINIKFCSNVQVYQAFSKPNTQCSLTSSNLKLYMNGIAISSSQPVKFGRGISNKFSFSLSTCDQTVQLDSSWSLNKQVSEGLEEPMDLYCSIENSNSSEFTFKQNELDFNDYVLRVYAIDSSNPANFALLGPYVIKVGASPLITRFQNGVKLLSVEPSENLALNFVKNTYDPDSADKSDQTDMKFLLFCVQAANNDLLAKLKKEIEKKNYDFPGMNLIYNYQGKFVIKFYEKSCLSNGSNAQQSLVKFDSITGLIELNSTYLSLNDSAASLSFQLFVIKGNRMSTSQLLSVSMDLTAIFSVNLDTDIDQMAKKLDSLTDLAKQNPQKALSFVNSFTDVINAKSDGAEFGQDQTTEASTTTSTTSSTPTANNSVSAGLSNLRGKVLNTLNVIVVGVEDASSIITAANATAAVSSNSKQMPLANQEIGSQALQNMGEKAKNLTGESAGVVTDLALNMLNAGSNMFGAAYANVPKAVNDQSDPKFLEPVNDTEPAPVPAKYEAPAEFYSEDDDSGEFPEDRYQAFLDAEEKKRLADEEDRKKAAQVGLKTFSGILGAGQALASVTNQSNETRVETAGLALVVGNRNVSEGGDQPQTFSSNSGSSIKMPSLSSVLNDSAPNNIQTKMIAAGSNPYQNSAAQVSGSIVSLELTDSSGNPIKVSNTSEPFVIRIQPTSVASAFRASVPRVGYTIHKLYIKNKSSIHIVIKPDIEGDHYFIYVKYSATRVATEYPDDTNFDFAFSSPNNQSFPDDPTGELRYTSYIPADQVLDDATYYIAVKLAKLADETLLLLNSTNSTENVTITSNYTGRIFSTSCRYYVPETNDWSTDGCSVSPETTYNSTVCLCNHLTTFGTDFYVPPNTIDFSSVWSKFGNLSDNAAVFATIISLIGVYIILAVLARIKDKRDLVKWGAVPLEDNLPIDRYYYLISVQTGVGKETGTKSKVGFVLVGEWTDSGVRKLSDGKRKDFPGGSILNFILSVEEPLGPLTHLRIWHDNSGSGRSQSWYLNTITVVDLQNKEKANFICNNWLAVEKGDGQVDRLLPIASDSDERAYSHLFTQSVKKKFTDSHLWYSVVSRPTRSSFTRLQRLSCCFSLLFCTMISNAMFYRSEPANAQGSNVIKLGPLKFSMTQIWTSFVSTLIVVPVNLLIVTIFRKAKLKHHGIVPTRKVQAGKSHVVKKEFWRHVEEIEINESYGESSSNVQNGVIIHDDDDDDYLSQSVSTIQLPSSKSKKDANVSVKESRFNIKKLFKKKPKTGEYKRATKEDGRNKKQGRWLPRWTIYLAWFLVFASILVPAFFIILYSMQWGKERSEAWLLAMFLSFFQSLFIIDPIKVFLLTALITCILRKVQDDPDEELFADSGDPIYNAIVAEDEEYLHNHVTSLSQVDMKEALRARRVKLTALKPVDPQDLRLQRIERQKQKKTNEILKEAAALFGFLVVVLLLSFQSRSQNSFMVLNDLENTLLNGNFSSIMSKQDMWKYIQNEFLPGIYAQTWYNGNSLTWREKLTIQNRYGLRVGSPRIRQLRIKANSCKVHPAMANIIDHCNSGYNWIDDETDDFDIFWQPIVNGTLTNSSTTTIKEDGVNTKKSKWKCQNAWCYQNSLQTKTAPVSGVVATYKGGGYAISLGRSVERSATLVNDLKEQNWLDQYTRAVFLEFTIYNANVNLFASATLLVEFLPTGGAVSFSLINVFQLYTYLGSFGLLVLVFEIIFILFLAYVVIGEIMKIKKEKKAYFKSFWNYNELIIIVASILAIIAFIIKQISTELAIKAVFSSELGEFVDFQTLAYWADAYTCICSVIVFCATLKFIRLLRFNKRIGLLSSTLQHATRDLFSFSIVFLVVFWAYGLFCLAIFGDHLKDYRDMLHTLASLFKFTLGVFDLKSLLQTNYYMATFYFVTFDFVVIMGLMTLFISILTEAFTKAKEELAKKKNEHDLVQYFVSKIKKIKSKAEIKKKKKPVEEDLNASNISLRVNVKKEEEELYTPNLNQIIEYDPNDLSRSSYNSLNFTVGRQEQPPSYMMGENDSLSMY